MDRKALKEEAKKTLNGKVGECAKILLIFLGISLAIGANLFFICEIFKLNKTIVDILTSLVEIIIGSMFSFGMLSFFLKMSRKEEVTYKELFSKIEMIWPYIVITIVTNVIVILWSLALIIPGIIAAISYSFAYLIYLDNPTMKPIDTLKESQKMLVGHKMDYFVLMLSFIGWIILGAFTLGILYFWLIPYMSLTECNFYNQLKNQK